MNIAQSTYSENGINENTIAKHQKKKQSPCPKEVTNQTVQLNMGTKNKDVQANSHKSGNIVSR